MNNIIFDDAYDLCPACGDEYEYPACICGYDDESSPPQFETGEEALLREIRRVKAQQAHAENQHVAALENLEEVLEQERRRNNRPAFPSAREFEDGEAESLAWDHYISEVREVLYKEHGLQFHDLPTDLDDYGWFLEGVGVEGAVALYLWHIEVAKLPPFTGYPQDRATLLARNLTSVRNQRQHTSEGWRPSTTLALPNGNIEFYRERFPLADTAESITKHVEQLRRDHGIVRVFARHGLQLGAQTISLTVIHHPAFDTKARVRDYMTPCDAVGCETRYGRAYIYTPSRRNREEAERDIANHVSACSERGIPFELAGFSATNVNVFAPLPDDEDGFGPILGGGYTDFNVPY